MAQKDERNPASFTAMRLLSLSRCNSGLVGIHLLNLGYYKLPTLWVFWSHSESVSKISFKKLRQQRFHDMAVDVCEAEVAALEAVGELGVIESKEVHDGGVEVVDVDAVFDNVEPKFI